MIWPIVQDLAKKNAGVAFLKIDVDEAQVQVCMCVFLCALVNPERA